MNKLLLIVMINLFSMTSLWSAENTFFGKYRIMVSQDFYGQAGIEVLINSKSEIKQLKVYENDVWEENTWNDVSAEMATDINSLGPFLNHMKVGFTYGSDEDGIATYVTLAWIGEEGEKELTVVSALTFYEDGPNGVSDVFKDPVVVEKWNKKLKKWTVLRQL